MFAADTVSIERPTIHALRGACASPLDDDATVALVRDTRGASATGNDATTALNRDAKDAARAPAGSRTPAELGADDPQTTKLERSLPSGPMATPNAEVMRRIVQEKERFLPRFVRLLKVTAPISEPAAGGSESPAAGSTATGTTSPYRLSWIIHLIAQWADPRCLGQLLRHLASPLPYAQDDVTWALTRFDPEVTIPMLSSIVMRSAGTTPHVVDGCLLALARTVVRLRSSPERAQARVSAMESQALAAIELILHREQTESTSRLLDAASYLAALRSESGWARILKLHEQGVFDSSADDRRDVYYLHELYDGRREHGLLVDADRDWLLPFIAEAAR